MMTELRGNTTRHELVELVSVPSPSNVMVASFDVAEGHNTPAVLPVMRRARLPESTQ